MKRDLEKEIVLALRNSAVRLDAGETAFITRELLSIKQKMYETEYPTLKALTFVPVATDVDAYAEAIAYQQNDGYGKAKIVANGATDLPSVSVETGEATTPVKTLAAQYDYSWLDLQRSARQRSPLSTRKAMTARKVVAEGIDSVTAAGDSDTGLIGFTNLASVGITAAAAAWGVATALQMYTEMANAVTAIPNSTKGIHEATDLILPLTAYTKAQITPWSSTGQSDLTVLKVFQANFPNVRVSSWYKLETAGAGGVKRMIAYDKNPDVVEAQLPLDFYELPAQAKGLALVTPCLARVGGVQCRFPKAMQYVDGL
jgi:hypothetical protein